MNQSLHPKHPGIGSSTSLISAEDPGDRTVGGLFIFFPSGLTKTIAWRSNKPIQPTKEAAQKYATEVAEQLERAGMRADLMGTNWASVTAAIQRIILDFNDRVKVNIIH